MAKTKTKRPVKMLKDNKAPEWAMRYGACATSWPPHDYQNEVQDHGHVCSRWEDGQ
jgi:hypothetical protein